MPEKARPKSESPPLPHPPNVARRTAEELPKGKVDRRGKARYSDECAPAYAGTNRGGTTEDMILRPHTAEDFLF